MYKYAGICFADLILFFLNTHNLILNYFIFIGYLKTGVGDRGFT